MLRDVEKAIEHMVQRGATVIELSDDPQERIAMLIALDVLRDLLYERKSKGDQEKC